jgi:ATP-dependent protease ClpP protease subunit
MTVNSIKNTAANTTARLSGTVASAGTIIALACKNVEVADHTAFMIHNYSGGLFGKGHELKAHQEFVDANLNKSFSSFYEGFLTPAEIKRVIDGKDYWMNKDEVLSRLDRKNGYSEEAILDLPKAHRRGRPRKDA